MKIVLQVTHHYQPEHKAMITFQPRSLNYEVTYTSGTPSRQETWQDALAYVFLQGYTTLATCRGLRDADVLAQLEIVRKQGEATWAEIEALLAEIEAPTP